MTINLATYMLMHINDPINIIPSVGAQEEEYRVDTGGQKIFSLTFPDFFLRKETFFPDHTNEKYIIFPDQSTFYISKLYVFETTIGVVYSRCANPPFVCHGKFIPCRIQAVNHFGFGIIWD